MYRGLSQKEGVWGVFAGEASKNTPHLYDWDLANYLAAATHAPSLTI